jgi:hypothetical protein
MPFDLFPMLRIVHAAVTRQHVREPADFPAAHRVGLAGQRKWPGAWLADFSGGEVEIDNRVILLNSDGEKFLKPWLCRPSA